jgi:hypothetical protein
MPSAYGKVRFRPMRSNSDTTDRGLTTGEVDMVRGIFGNAIDTTTVRIHRRKWHPFQSKNTTMAPCGHVHFHPKSPSYCDDFSTASPALQTHFIHEMAHVWQAQTRGKYWLILRRHPFCRYSYTLMSGKKLCDYGPEQQAEIIAHAFALRRGWAIPTQHNPRDYGAVVDFP